MHTRQSCQPLGSQKCYYSKDSESPGWPSTDQAGLDNDYVRNALGNRVGKITHFLEDKLINKQPRDDHAEFLELRHIFLGITPARSLRFHYPGTVHHARWMAKAIYSLKMSVSRDQFKLTAKEEKGLVDICIFIVDVYVSIWFKAPFAHDAPYNDLLLVKKLHEFQTSDTLLSRVELKKLSNHLWYLNPETAAMSFFDERVSDTVKENMVLALKTEEEEISPGCPKRCQINLKDFHTLCDKYMDQFITPQSINLFNRFGIDKEFLDTHPSLWHNDDLFKHGFLNCVETKSS